MADLLPVRRSTLMTTSEEEKTPAQVCIRYAHHNMQYNEWATRPEGLAWHDTDLAILPTMD